MTLFKHLVTGKKQPGGPGRTKGEGGQVLPNNGRGQAAGEQCKQPNKKPRHGRSSTSRISEVE